MSASQNKAFLNGVAFSLACAVLPLRAQEPLTCRWDGQGDVPPVVNVQARLLRERLLADPHRPRVHFCSPGVIARPGDPNGMFFVRGRYHLMYLYREATAPKRGPGRRFRWGHVSSSDLLHWRHHLDAIRPEGDSGAYSGGAFVDDDGTCYLSYAMLAPGCALGLVTNADKTYETWKRHPANPMIRCYWPGLGCVTNEDGKVVHFGLGDPSNIWKANGRYHVLMGSYGYLHRFGKGENAREADKGDRADLFTSDDLVRWRYRHSFYSRNPEWTGPDEDNSCTTFMPLPSTPEGGPPSGKWLMTFISHVRGGQYYIGEYDVAAERFVPEVHGRFSWRDNSCFAPETMMDGCGRQILMFWMQCDNDKELSNGWSGVYTLPRIVWRAADGSLAQALAPEVSRLRIGDGTPRSLKLSGNGRASLLGAGGAVSEILVAAAREDAGCFRLEVLASEDGREKTVVGYDPSAGELFVDARQSGSAGRRIEERAPLALAPGERLRLRVIVDRSIVEVFANDRQAISRRVYPQFADSENAYAVAAGGLPVELETRTWTLNPTNPF